MKPGSMCDCQPREGFSIASYVPVASVAGGEVVVLRADYRGGLMVESVIGGQWARGGWILPVLMSDGLQAVS